MLVCGHLDGGAAVHGQHPDGRSRLISEVDAAKDEVGIVRHAREPGAVGGPGQRVHVAHPGEVGGCASLDRHHRDVTADAGAVGDAPPVRRPRESGEPGERARGRLRGLSLEPHHEPWLPAQRRHHRDAGFALIGDPRPVW